MLKRWIHLLEILGAPVERLLSRSGIAVNLLEFPDAVVPLDNAFRFIELSCSTLGSEHVGLHVGQSTRLDDLGAYGDTLKKALTVYDYLNQGVALYNTLVTGQRIWLSTHGDQFRLNIKTDTASKLGAYQAHLAFVQISITQLREAVGPGWSPTDIGLAYQSAEELPDVDVLSGSQVSRGTDESYISLSPELMQIPFHGVRRSRKGTGQNLLYKEVLPEDLGDLVQIQVENLMSDRPFRPFNIDTVADSLSLSRRSLQRKLKRQGLDYSQILTGVRMQLAADWLENTDKPVIEISYNLGYSDHSNFTRAFRYQSGISPKEFRHKVK